jgi:hypothetical protein
MKSIFTLILGAQLGAAGLTLAAAPSVVLLAETFEDYEVGTAPTGWTVNRPELMNATVEPNPEGGKALSLHKPEASDDSPLLLGPLLKDVPGSGIVCVKARVMAMQDAAVGSLIIQAPGGTNNVVMNVGRSPMLTSNSLTGGFIRLPVEFKPGQWVDLLFRLDLDAKTYDAFVNGTLAASNVGYDLTTPGRSAFQIWFSFNRSSQGTFLLDNLEIVEGDVAPGASFKEKQQ